MKRFFFLLFFFPLFASAEIHTYSGTKTFSGNSPSFGVSTFTCQYELTFNTETESGTYTLVFGESTGANPAWVEWTVAGYRDDAGNVVGGAGGSKGAEATTRSGTFALSNNPDGLYIILGWISSGVPSQRYNFPFVLQPQTVTVTPTHQDTPLGEPKSFTASGGHNGYIWDMDAGVTYTVTMTGGGSETISVTGITSGTYSISVYSPEGEGYQESNVATATLVVGDSEAFYVKVNETNMTKHTLRYRVLWKGTVLATFTLAPGQVFRNRYEVTDATPGTIEYQIVGTEKDGTIWIKKETESSVYIPGKTIPSIKESKTTPTPSTTTESVVDGKDVPKKPSSAGGIWQSITGDNKNDPTTAEQTAEGIDKLISELQELKDITEGTPVEGEGFPGEAGEGAALPESANADAMVDGLSGLIPSTITLPTSVGQNGIWSISVPVPYLQSGEIDISMDLTRFGTAVSAFRAMLLACECIVFFYVSVSVIRGAFAS